MRHIPVWLSALGCALCLFAEDSVEYRYLGGLADPKRWAPEECETSVAPHTVWQQPALRLRIPVDFSAGEKQYPIGWPRMYLNLKADEQDWKGYDRFEFQLFTETARTSLPKRPLNFHLYDAQGQRKMITLDLAAIGAWKTFSLNLSDLGLPGRVTRLGFNINESDYNDKDVVDFHLGGFRLARATAAQVTALTAVTPALFCHDRVLAVEVVAEGPPEKLADGLPVQLRSGDRVALACRLPVTRGRQTLFIPLNAAKLEPGIHALVVNPDAPTLRKEVHVTVFSSPYWSAEDFARK